MSIINIEIRTQVDLKTDLSARLYDEADARWTAAQKYAALNSGLAVWAGKGVRVPFLYEFDLLGSTYEYALPGYIDGPIMVQRVALPSGQPGSSGVWENVPYWKVYPTTTGTRILRLDFLPGVAQGRIIWFGRNGPLPATLPVTNGVLAADGTSFTLTSAPKVGRSGFVKIDGETMSYAGTTEGSSTLVADNLVHGIDSTAASHLAGATVTWCVAVHRYDLYEQLMLEAQVYLHNLYLNRTQSGQDKDSHMEALRLAKQQAIEFWRGYTPIKSPSLRPNRHTIGPGNWNTEVLWQTV